MRNPLLLTFSQLLVLTAMLARGADTLTINFDGLSQSPQFPLTNQIPGLLFDSVQVVTPATIGNSPGVPLSAATSGQSAAFTSGAVIYFSNAVFKVQMTISPSFITVGPSMQAGWATAYLVAHKQDGTILTRSQTEVIYGAAKFEDVTNFTPSTISVSATTPIAYVTVDLDDPFNYGGVSFFFDDLILTLGKQWPAVHPTIQIEAPKYQRVYMNWYYQGCVLQWTTNLTSGIWQDITPSASGYTADITQAPDKFFRVKRLIPSP